MYTLRPPFIYRALYPGALYRVAKAKNEVFLTFDDGPHPEITPKVLALLAKHNAKATFFMVGSRVERYPDVVKQIIGQGHAIGNHSWSHKDGFTTPLHDYLIDVNRGAEVTTTRLFRPPYGRILPAQYRNIAQTAKVVMWDVLSADFDAKLDAPTCAKNVLDNMRPGSIVVFHDSEKAAPRLFKSLETVLVGLQKTRWASLAINSD